MRRILLHVGADGQFIKRNLCEENLIFGAALGRSWLGEKGGQLMLEHAELFERLRADALYLTLGLSRAYQGQYWPLVVGVHVVPDYDAAIDVDCL